MYEVSGSVATLREGVAVAAGFVRSDLLAKAESHAGVSVPPDLDDPWLGDPWADVSWGADLADFTDLSDLAEPSTSAGPADSAPGPELVAQLCEVDVTALDANELVDAVAAWERVAAWVRARQVTAVAELSRRPEMLPRSSAHGIASLTPGSITAAELAAAMPLTKRQAENLVGESVQLAQDFPATLDALASGRLDVRRARVVVDELGSLDSEVRRAVEAAVIAAPTVDPTAATAAADAVDATVLRRTLKRAVHELAPVTVEERRVRAHKERFVRVTPAADGMAWLEGLLAAEDAIALKTTLDAAARELKRRDDAAGDLRTRTMDQRRADALAALTWSSLSTGRLGGHDCACPSGLGIRLGARQGRPVAVQVTVPFATVAGLDDAPGELVGYGPIPASVARRLAAAGVWRWLAHDSVTGALLSYGRSRYTPPAELVEFIVARDQECRMPRCRRPARECELDHTVPFPTGPTAVGNVGAVCSFHHHLKHHSGWQVVQPEPGIFVWTSPTGRTSTVRPADLRAHRHRTNPDTPDAGRADGGRADTGRTDDDSGRANGGRADTGRTDDDSGRVEGDRAGADRGFPVDRPPDHPPDDPPF